MRTSQQSITANFRPLTAHIYHVMIIVTGGYSRISFLSLFPRNFLNDLELTFLEFKHFNKTHRPSFLSFYLFILYSFFLQSLCILTLSTFCTFPFASSAKEKTKSFNLTSNTFRCEI